uniref:Melanoregulin n=1 Tax=Cyclopterus lumpus TaxID=8103 RepID=A0A8C3AP69_CYCLU
KARNQKVAENNCLEWEKLNYDIHSLRYARREVRSRWKKILLQLGYQCEVEALLCVNKRSRFSRDQDQLNKATQLLKQLLDRTSLFPPETAHQSKYLCVMDRLVSLDSAEDFVRLAKEKYPKQSSLRVMKAERNLTPLPFLNFLFFNVGAECR